MTQAGEQALAAISKHWFEDPDPEHICVGCGADLGHPLHGEYHMVTEWNEGVWAGSKAEAMRGFEEREALRAHRNREDSGPPSLL